MRWRRRAYGFGDVDFAGCGPDSVGRVDGQQPNGRPHPVAHGHLGYDFDFSIFDRRSHFCGQAGGFDWVDDGAVGGVCCGDAVMEGSVCAVTTQVEDVVGVDEVFVLEGGLDVESTVFDEGVFGV